MHIKVNTNIYNTNINNIYKRKAAYTVVFLEITFGRFIRALFAKNTAYWKQG